MATRPRAAATESDLLNTPEDGWKRELVDGQIRVSPAGSRHGQVCVNVILHLGGLVRERQLGYVFDSSTGFRPPGGNARLPDVAFVAKGRFPGEQLPEGFSDVPPHLAVEVLSPDDRSPCVLERVGEYLQAGVRLVWVIDPARRTGVVHKSMTDVRQIGPEDALEGGDVLPGFACRLGEIVS
jgi:Uma2 family endonuclease